MAHYGSRSPKRHQGFSNNRWVEKYNMGRLLKSQRKVDPDFQPTTSWVDAKGKKRWQGTKQLKETQSGALFWDKQAKHFDNSCDVLKTGEFYM